MTVMLAPGHFACGSLSKCVCLSPYVYVCVYHMYISIYIYMYTYQKVRCVYAYFSVCVFVCTTCWALVCDPMLIFRVP